MRNIQLSLNRLGCTFIVVLLATQFLVIEALAEIDNGNETKGIHGGDARTRGIDATDETTLGIHGEDRRTRGIHGGDRRTRGIADLDGTTLGIHGGDARTRGIDATDETTLGIHGGDRRTRGIHGGDRRTRGIAVTDNVTLGIHGGDRRTRTVGETGNFVFQSAAMGPVESVEVFDGGVQVTVLGQTFVGGEDLISVDLGDYVLVAASHGFIEVLMPIGVTYVPGASPVLVRGAVETVATSTAEITIGDLSVDYSEQLSTDPTFSPVLGEYVEFTGVQPTPRKRAILNSQEGQESYLAGIHGGDRRTRGIHGGDRRTRGIHGGDTR